ncbi:hypothetical protein Peur_071822 [Populus x canadensis]
MSSATTARSLPLLTFISLLLLSPSRDFYVDHRFLRDLNVRLIGVHGSSFDFANGSLCITNVWITRVMGRPARLVGSRIDPPGRFEFNNYASNILSF